MAEKETKREGSYSSLTGFKRAVPIILFAVALFVALCFITKNTGAFGRGASNVLLGLFSYGAYAVPALIALHAFFFPSDVARKRVLSRAIFSSITLIFVSALVYAIMNIGEELAFTPKQFYFDGIELKSGGFIGSVIAYALIKVFGNVGLIIITLAIFALYISYFFPKGSVAPRKILVAVLTAVVWVFNAVESLAKRISSKRKASKDKKRKKQLSKKDAELFHDEYFAVDNGMQELAISELGIKETRNRDAIESNPTLHDKVRPKSAVDDDDFVKVTDEKSDFDKEAEVSEEYDGGRRRRKVNMSYGSTSDNLNEAVGEEDVHRTDDIIIDGESAEDIFERAKEAPSEKREESYLNYGLDESAERVFTKDFDPFDFAVNEARANKPSSKSSEIGGQGLGEYEEPVAKFSPEDIEKARRNADFEMKKKAIIDARRQAIPVDNKGEATESAKNVAINVESSVDMTADEDRVHSYSVKIDKHENAEYTATATESAYAAIPKDEKAAAYEPQEPERTEAPIQTNEPPRTSQTYTERREQTYFSGGYTGTSAGYRPASSNAKDVYKRAAAFSAVITEYTDEDNEEPNRATDTFHTYTVPSYDPPRKEEPAVKESTESLRIERINLTPEPDSFVAPEIKEEHVVGGTSYSTAQSVTEEKITVSVDIPVESVEKEASVTDSVDDNDGFDFVQETSAFDSNTELETIDSANIEDEEDEADDDLSVPTEDDDGDFEVEEIPEDEQNEDVIAMRRMFPILDADTSRPQENNYTYAEREDEYSIKPTEVNTADEPPFDADERDDALKGLIEEVPEEPEKPKKPDYSNYEFPPMDILGFDNTSDNDVTEQEINENADKLIETLMSFKVTASVKGVDRGPRITRYEIVPGAGVKVAQITNLFDDIQLNLAADGIRMEAPIPGKSAIGFEIPNKKPATVRLRELLETEEFVTNKSKTFVCVGKDVAGYPVFGDIAKMPHVLIAGATGMGKSVCINAIMISMLYKAKPDEVKFIMIDPKKVEFTMYNGIPHLLIPVVTDPKQAAGALMWAVEQMEKRYEMIEKLSVRNIEAYNAKVAENPSLGEPMSKIVIVIDELNDLMIQVRDPVENLIMSLAQKSRAAGIHLIIGTQRPSVNVITGVIKANIPSRISCKVMSNTDSRTILDSAGAEKLLDKGDMLFHPVGKPKPIRVQGAFVSDKEVEDIMDYLKKSVEGQYDSEALEEINRAAQKCIKKKDSGSDYDDDDDDREDNGGYYNDRQFLDAVDIALNSGKISTSLIQRKLSIGYGKAAKFIDVMEDIGIVSEPNGQKPRDVLITKDEWIEKLSRVNLD